MSKESKNDADASPSSFEGVGGMNTGVAIVGFILCFISGAGLMWGYDSHRLKKGEIGADTTTAAAGGGNWSDEESPVPISSKDPTWGKRDAPVTIVIFVKVSAGSGKLAMFRSVKLAVIHRVFGKAAGRTVAIRFTALPCIGFGNCHS